MIDLKKLLVCDGRPSKEMIDYIVDLNIKKIVENIISASQSDFSLFGNTVVDGFLNVEKNLKAENSYFSIPSYAQYYSEVVDEVKKSTQRYPSLLTAIEISNEKSLTFGKDPNFPVSINFLLSINITPEMKKAILLDQELPSNPEEKNRKLKI
jgi:hypothetical protein